MSEKSIAQKLFIKSNSRFLLVNPPDGYLARLGELPLGTVLLSDSSSSVETIQVFVANQVDL
jgi:hypothetical protein